LCKDISMSIIDPSEKIRKVELSPPDPTWPHCFNETVSEIKVILQDNCLEVHHIGSTAISGIYAKPIIDVLVVVKNIKSIDSLNSAFEAHGYICMGEYGITGRRFYWKSRTSRTHNIHVFEKGSPEINRHIAFRDFMREHKNHAKAYSTIKRCLAKVFTEDIENYVDGKASFVQMIDYKTGTARNKQLKAKDNFSVQAHDPIWTKLAQAEINAFTILASDLPFKSIEHTGSTSTPGQSSEPIIEVSISISSLKNTEPWIALLDSMGYTLKDPTEGPLCFIKGMPPHGEKRTHIIYLSE